MAKFEEEKVINCLHLDKAEIGKKYYFSDSLYNLKVVVENGNVSYVGELTCATNMIDVIEPFQKDNQQSWGFIYPYEEPPKQRMTNRQLAEDYEIDCIADVYKDDVCTIPYAYSAQKLEQAYLDGLAEGSKEKWHNLEENPNDLPTVSNSQFIWMCWINPYGNMSYHQGYYDDKGFYWIDEQFCTKYYPVSDIIAWCKLPEFKR